MINKYKFPVGFIWGTATSAHQTEGNNSNSDWWEYENHKNSGQHYPLEPSGIACDSYNRYEEDFDLAVKLNTKAARISVEWARLEPTEGNFSQEEFEHYKKVLQAAKSRNLQTFVTLHHFTHPKWLIEKGRWESFKMPSYFAKYSKKCAEELGEYTDIFLTINEPQVYTLMGYIEGKWPPAKVNSYIKSLIVQINLVLGHRKAYDAIKSVNKEYKVGIVKQVTNYETREGESIIFDNLICGVLNFAARHLILMGIFKKFDLIGINYYFTNRIIKFKQRNPNDYVSDLNWWINPGGIEPIILELWRRYKKPIYVTENGIADSKDKYRKQYIRDHLLSIHTAISKGADVRGYFHWSLIDNFEWHEGFWPRFGLVEIDRNNNLERKPRESFYYYAEICRTNEVGLEL